MLGGGTGPATGTNATTCTPGPWNIHRMLQAAEAFPINLGFLGKGNGSLPQPLREQIEAGALGLKLHEDWGSTPARHRLLPRRGGGIRRTGGHPHRHAQRSRLCRRFHRGVSRPHHPHLPHRGCWRRPRPRYPAGVRRGQRAAVVHQPDTAFHGEHAGRASGHADGVPPPRRQPAGGRGVRRIAHPSRDHRRRGHPATTWAPSA